MYKDDSHSEAVICISHHWGYFMKKFVLLFLCMFLTGCTSKAKTDISPQVSVSKMVESRPVEEPEETIKYEFKEIKRQTIPLEYSALNADINDIMGWLYDSYGVEFNEFTIDDTMLIDPVSSNYRLIYDNDKNCLDVHIFDKGRDNIFHISTDCNVRYEGCFNNTLNCEDMLLSTLLNGFIDSHKLNINEPVWGDDYVVLNSYGDKIEFTNDDSPFVTKLISHDIAVDDTIEYVYLDR